VDGTGTVATEDRFERLKQNANTSLADNGQASGAVADEAGPINENLFLDEDLDGLDDELNDLDVDDSDENPSTEN
jgi:hypothetical protein